MLESDVCKRQIWWSTCLWHIILLTYCYFLWQSGFSECGLLAVDILFLPLTVLAHWPGWLLVFDILFFPFDSSGSLNGLPTCLWHIVLFRWQFRFADWVVYHVYLPLTYCLFDILYFSSTVPVRWLGDLLAFDILFFPLTVLVRWLGGLLAFDLLFIWYIVLPFDSSGSLTGWSTCLWHIVNLTYCTSLWQFRFANWVIYLPLTYFSFVWQFQFADWVINLPLTYCSFLWQFRFADWVVYLPLTYC